MKAKSILLLLLIVIGTVSCQKEKVQDNDDNLYPILKLQRAGDDLRSEKAASASIQVTSDLLDEININLAEAGMNIRVMMAELNLDAQDGLKEDIIYSQDVGNKQSTADFVPNDPRAEWKDITAGPVITYAIDQVDAIPLLGGLSASETTEAIEMATSIWDGASCSEIGLTRVDDENLDLAFTLFFYGIPWGTPYIIADIQHVGFTDWDFEEGVIAVTFTFIWTDDDGPTDINNDGKADVALREIYYDPSYVWSADGTPEYNEVDLVTISAHELGHGLSQGHFGTAVIVRNSYIRIAPRALMNPYYLGVLRDLTGTDEAGHCSIWADWPIH